MMTCFCTQTIRTSFLVILLYFTSIWLKKCSGQRYKTLNTKPSKNGNQSKITTFFTQIFCTSFSVILLFFAINTGQKFKSFGTKTRKSYNPTLDDLFLHPNHLHIICGHFIVVSHQYG